MRFVFVLEDDPRVQKEIVDAIQNIDPKIQTRLFNSLNELFVWIKALMKDGPASIASAGALPAGQKPVPIPESEALQLVAVVSKVEFLGARQIPLLKKTRAMFIDKKVCTAEDPTAFVLTTHDAPTFQVRDLEDRILNNVILKPFDQLILIQHLTFAIDGRHPASKYTIANQKTKSQVEMLKSVDMIALSEVGFVTRSDRNIEKKIVVSKYYGDLFKSPPKNSLMAKVIDCKADPADPKQFICSFSFFGISPGQIGAVRKKAKSKPADFKYEWKTPTADAARASRPFGIVVIEEDQRYADDLNECFKKIGNTAVTFYKSYNAFCMNLDPSLLDTPEDKKKEKSMAFPKDVDVSIVFASNGTQIVDFVKSKPDPVNIFGVKDLEIKGNITWWSHAFPSDLMSGWKDWLNNPNNNIILPVKSGNSTFYVKPVSNDKDPNKGQYTVKFAELTDEERHSFLSGKSTLPKVTDLVLMSHRFFKAEEGEKWAAIEKSFKAKAGAENGNYKPQLIMMASKDYTDAELKQFGAFTLDLLYRPLDRTYFLQKLKLYFPELQAKKEPIEFSTIAHQEFINTASPVPISEISEAGLVMQYYRKISNGAFREFILWQAYEIDSAKILGTCNYSIEGGEKEVFNNHFVFFAINDRFLKTIRIWIRENYILNKEKG